MLPKRQYRSCVQAIASMLCHALDPPICVRRQETKETTDSTGGLHAQTVRRTLTSLRHLHETPCSCSPRSSGPVLLLFVFRFSACPSPAPSLPPNPLATLLSPPRLCVFELFSPSSPLVRTTRDSTWINQTLAGRRAGVGRRGVRRLSRHPRAACLDWRGRIGLLLEVKESQIPGDDLLSSARLPWGTRAHTPGLSSSAVQWWLHSFPSKLSQSGTPSIGQVQTEFSGEPSATTPETKQ